MHVPQRVQLALLPTTSPWLTARWALYSYQPKPKVLAACLRQWHQTGGAELVASWDCMLQLVTARRPEFGQESWHLARQHLALGRDLQIPQLSLAWSLTHSDTWFLKQF